MIFIKSLHYEVTKNAVQLLNNPLIGIAIENTNYRKILISYNSIFYKIQDSKTIIILFWDNRRSPDLLEKELGKIL